MRIYHMTEQPYPEAWAGNESLRVSLPNRLCDPAKAADLYHRYLDEWLLADELGLDIMVNEHHATATCMSASATVPLAILARQTKRARLLVLGVPLANRYDPLRVAEEMSMIDVISRGRLEMGFVKGVPYEIPVSNANPVRMMDRLWEAHDFILKAMTTHDAPFNWESEHFFYRNVNLWPRPFQAPHPPVWVTATSYWGTLEVAKRGYVTATFMTGYDTKKLFDGYRQVWREQGRGEPGLDRFAYLALAACASSESEAMRRADKVVDYLRTTGRVAPWFRNPPGYLGPEPNAHILRAGSIAPPPVTTKSGHKIHLHEASLHDLIEAGILVAGTPDQVYQQIAEFSDAVGGFGHLLLMAQAGFLNHEDTADSLTLIGKEVLPRLKERIPASAAA